jgi:hypothetical protein
MGRRKKSKGTNKKVLAVFAVIVIAIGGIAIVGTGSTSDFKSLTAKFVPFQLFTAQQDDILRDNFQYNTLTDPCDLKMTTTAFFQDGTSEVLQSDFDFDVSQVFGVSFDILSPVTGSITQDYLNEVKIFCPNIKLSNGNIQETRAFLTGDTKILTYAKDLDGSEKLVFTSTVQHVGNAGSFGSVFTRMNSNDLGFGEFTIGEVRVPANVIDQNLAEHTTIYNSQVRHVLQGGVTIEIPKITELIGTKHSSTHLIGSLDDTRPAFDSFNFFNPLQVQNLFDVKIDKAPDSCLDPVFNPDCGAGNSIDILSYSPNQVDSTTSSNNLITINAKLDDWSELEGLPYIEVYDLSKVSSIDITLGNLDAGKIYRGQMEFTGTDIFSTGLADASFRGTYLVPINQNAGTYSIKVMSNTFVDFFGLELLARTPTPTVNFEVVHGATDDNGSGIFCPVLTHEENGECVWDTIQCPAGQHQEGNSCVTDTFICPSGSSMINGQCVPDSVDCPSGQQLVNINGDDQCVIIDSCPSGFHESGGSCVANEPTSCPFGQELQNINGVSINQCIQDQDTGSDGCPAGQHESTTLTGITFCVDNEDACEDPLQLVNGICTDTTDLTIKSSQVFYDFKITWANGDVQTRQAGDGLFVSFLPFSFTEDGRAVIGERVYQTMSLNPRMDFNEIGQTIDTLILDPQTLPTYGYDIRVTTAETGSEGDLITDHTKTNEGRFNVAQLREVNSYNSASGILTLASIDLNVNELITEINNKGYRENCNPTDVANGVCKKLDEGDKIKYSIYTIADNMKITTNGVDKRTSWVLKQNLNLQYQSGIPQDPCTGLSGQALLNCIGDADGDGFFKCDFGTQCRDPIDSCPSKAGVLPDGCPLVEPPCVDTDNDGVCNDEDACPLVDGSSTNNGCPDVTNTDADGDGFDNNVDACPTVSGVAPNGCPQDTTSCENNPLLAKCLDSDQDGLNDAIDECPFEFGAPDSIPQRCPVICAEGDSSCACTDRDGDGFCDNLDQCPDIEGGVQGCPDLDADKDGVDVPTDQCPFEFGNTPNGCPEVDPNLDSDDDGIPNNDDICPTIKGEAVFQGCTSACQANPDLNECQGGLKCDDGLTLVSLTQGDICVDDEFQCDLTGDFPTIEDCKNHDPENPFQLGIITVATIAGIFILLIIIAVVIQRRR